MSLLYSLTTIEDAQTPLAPTPQPPFEAVLPWLTGALIVLILALVAVMTRYVLSCSKERQRITYITEEYKLEPIPNLPKWKLSKLKEIRRDLEDLVVMGSLS